MSSTRLGSKGSGVGSTLSRAASKFLMGSSEHVRNASYWKSVDEDQHDHEGVSTPKFTSTTPKSAGSPWWLQDDLWEGSEADDYELPAYPPPSYADVNTSRAPIADVVTPSGSQHADDFSAANLVAKPAALNRTLTAISLKPQSQDDMILAYKGRGRGRRRRMGGLRRSGSTGSLSPGDLSPKALATPTNPISRPKIHKVSIPFFTVIITAIDIIMMIWEFVEGKGFASPKLNPMLGPNGIVLLTMGGKWVPSILKAGEWWRFLTSIFLHGGLVHIVLNLLVQTKLLWDMERVHGTFRVVPIYILSGVGGMVLSAVFLPKQVTVGASGAIFGFHAVLLVDLVKNWSQVKSPKMKLLMVGISIVIAFAMGLVPGIDNFAHFGGFIVGLLAAFVFLPSMHIGGWSVGMRLLQVCIALPLLIGYFIGVLVPFYHGLDGSSFCSWCHYIACLPFWKTCNGGQT